MTKNEMIHEKPHMRYLLESAKHKETLDEIKEVLRHHKEINEVLDKIRAEIEKPLHDERCFDTADAKAQYIALNWVCELIDKHIKEIEGEDIGDYPDEIPNQFDNLTGSVNI